MPNMHTSRFVVLRLGFVLNNVTHVFEVYLTDYG